VLSFEKLIQISYEHMLVEYGMNIQYGGKADPAGSYDLSGTIGSFSIHLFSIGYSHCLIIKTELIYIFNNLNKTSNSLIFANSHFEDRNYQNSSISN